MVYQCNIELKKEVCEQYILMVAIVTRYLVTIVIVCSYLYVNCHSNDVLGYHSDSSLSISIYIVPSPLQVNYIVYGPSAVYLYWQSLDEGSLRGNVLQQSYTLSLNNVTSFDITDTSYNFTTNLIADSAYTFQLSVSNGVLRSPLTILEVTTFKLPPTPVEVSVTNVSFIVNVNITDEHASYLSSITIIVDVS